jgi:hypothetical protein
VPATCGVNSIVAKGRPLVAVFETAGFRFRYAHGFVRLAQNIRARAILVFVVVVVPIRDPNPPSERHEGGYRLRASDFSQGEK